MGEAHGGLIMPVGGGVLGAAWSRHERRLGWRARVGCGAQMRGLVKQIRKGKGRCEGKGSLGLVDARRSHYRAPLPFDILLCSLYAHTPPSCTRWCASCASIAGRTRARYTRRWPVPCDGSARRF